MAKTLHDIAEMNLQLSKLGNTPLLHLHNLFGVKNLYVKDESSNPTHTFKDRLALEMLQPLIDKINSGAEVHKTTFGSISYGNTAFSLGYYCNELNKQYGSEIVNAIGFIPPQLKSKTFGPDTSGKYLHASEMLKKVSEVSHLIEIDLSKKIIVVRLKSGFS